ncbi:MAG TPA: transglycosylase domain-containing protein [Pseudoxanthomonas sp.]|nr:transglycosylase domain-containing protein [Pseudoxanthomonas sp.]
MVKKRLKIILLGVALFLISYLSIAALWASFVAAELLQTTPSANHQIAIQPQHLAALIKIEDPEFYAHRGLSISDGQGLTTITSVVARDLFLNNQDLNGLKGAFQAFYRAVFSCCKRIDFGRDIMAVVLNAHATKQQQLNLFINDTYWGAMNGKAVIGMEAAARAFYGKDVLELTDDEFYGLIAMPIAPNRYHPIVNPELHAERAQRIMAVVTGQCAPSGWLDLTYDHCDGGRPN